ncbi:MAG: hypothetical protein ACXWJF_06020, partial [Burkholderiaceae bacterium]
AAFLATHKVCGTASANFVISCFAAYPISGKNKKLQIKHILSILCIAPLFYLLKYETAKY